MVTKLHEIIGEKFFLTQLEAGIVASSDAECENFAIQYTYAPIWKWQVPVNWDIVLLPEHKFGVHIEDDEAAPAEWRDDQLVRVEVWDANLDRMHIVYRGRYVQSKELQDKDKMTHLTITEPLWLKAGDWIYIMGYSPNTIYTIDVSDSYFSLETERARPTIMKS